jgi:Tfp pilus assembly protein PilX
MIKAALILKNEDGYFLILATLMILVLLTILGIASSRTANTEIIVAGNEIIYQRNFYRAEGAAIQAMEILANTPDLKDNPPDWLELAVGALKDSTTETYWDDAGIATTLDPTGNTRYIAGLDYLALGTSMDMAKPKAFAINVYGLCQTQGNAMIKVGYRKIF